MEINHFILPPFEKKQKMKDTASKVHKREHFYPSDDFSYDAYKKVDQFTETYCDTSSFELLDAQCWLTKRNSATGSRWILKESLPSRDTGVLSYHFHEGEAEILAFLHEKFGWVIDDLSHRFSNVFAFFTTYRLHYDSEFYWIDICNFGGDEFYLLGTMDLSQNFNETSLYQLLRSEVSIFAPAPSKIIAYLRKYEPHVLVKVVPPVSGETTWAGEHYGFVAQSRFDVLCLPGPFVSPFDYSDDSGNEASDDDDVVWNPVLELERAF